MKPLIFKSDTPPEFRPHMDRIIGYDLARGIAILAMVIINTKAVFSSDGTLPLWLCRGIELMDRRAAVVLVMLAGAGISLLLGKNSIAGKRVLINRAVFLFLTGSLLSSVWVADILHFYGVFILMGAFSFRLAHRTLLALAGLFWIGGVLAQLEPALFFLEELEPDSTAGYLADLLFCGFYPVFPWAAFFWVGMWLGRRDKWDPKFILAMMAAGSLILVLLTLLSIFVYIDIDLNIPTPWSIPSGLGTGLCVIALSMYWTAFPERPWVAYLSKAGRNTLSLYVIHILFMRAVGLISGQPDEYGITVSVGGAIVFFIIYMGLMECWLSRHARGPLETVMRRFCFQTPKREAACPPVP